MSQQARVLMCAVLIFAFILIIGSDADAANTSGAFSAIGDKLWDIGSSLISGVGRGAVLIGGGWAVLSYIGQVGGMSQAVSVFVAGLFLSYLPMVVDFIFRGM